MPPHPHRAARPLACQPAAGDPPQRPASRLTNQIRLLRFLAQEMTQAELGRRVGLTRQSIAAIEAGRHSPSLECAFQIAEVFGKPLGEVFAWEQPTTWTPPGQPPHPNTQPAC